jgi:hypothetical protein
MRTLLICHHDVPLIREGLPRWLGSFSDLAGVVVLRDSAQQVRNRVRRQWKREGLVRFIDLAMMRLWYRARWAGHDARWQAQRLEEMRQVYAAPPRDLPILETSSPNGATAEAFVRQCRPDVILACCKHLLKPQIFELATTGTFVMHPGIVPEYRNAHGCFWALRRGDLGKVGMSLLKIDRGIDTGPVYGYYSTPVNEWQESHIGIQRRMTFENLPAIAERLQEIHDGAAVPVPTLGRPSAEWGQPTLSAYLAWKWQALMRGRSTVGGRVNLPEISTRAFEVSTVR